MRTSLNLKRLATLMLGASLLAYSMTPAKAAPIWHSAKVATIYPMGNGDVVLTFDNDAPTCTNASNPKYYYMRVGANGMTQEGLENMLAVALTAANSGQTVTINFDDSSTGCFINRLYVSFSST